MTLFRTHLISGLIVAIAALGMSLASRSADEAIGRLAEQHEGDARRAAEAVAVELSVRFDRIHDSLRTVASLPDIRALALSDAPIGPEARAIADQIYGRLATQFDVSTLFVAPVDFAPDRLDLGGRPRALPVELDHAVALAGQKGRNGSSASNCDASSTGWPNAIPAPNASAMARPR
jgi:hypothetical protein